MSNLKTKRMLPQMKAAILKGASVQFKGLKPAERVPLGKAFDNFIRAFSGFTVDADGITEIEGGNRIAWKDVTEFGVAEEQTGTGIGRGIRLMCSLLKMGIRPFAPTRPIGERPHPAGHLR